ncbi:MAG: hypothetical protein PWQ96_2168, partial [Clostridia bacterium]|nr:hypothetical protein [Clostridia bacterium]
EKEHDRHEKFKAAQTLSSGGYIKVREQRRSQANLRQFEVDFARTFRTSSLRLKGGMKTKGLKNYIICPVLEVIAYQYFMWKKVTS